MIKLYVKPSTEIKESTLNLEDLSSVITLSEDERFDYEAMVVQTISPHPNNRYSRLPVYVFKGDEKIVCKTPDTLGQKASLEEIKVAIESGVIVKTTSVSEPSTMQKRVKGYHRNGVNSIITYESGGETYYSDGVNTWKTSTDELVGGNDNDNV